MLSNAWRDAQLCRVVQQHRGMLFTGHVWTNAVHVLRHDHASMSEELCMNQLQDDESEMHPGRTCSDTRTNQEASSEYWILMDYNCIAGIAFTFTAV
ncbi:hypothetical protein WMY93_029047 [Mugilogobius chulae]|uniref:Uncharacterized protein n=1 Tax=Mugilogobius chulae TaxID=88201 RepID=A0AAW0N2D3_9GOBI